MGTHSNFTSAFRALNSKIEQAKKATMKQVANEGTRFWIENFNDQGFTDVSFIPWKGLKNVSSRRGRQYKTIKGVGTDEREGKKIRVKITDVRSVKKRAILVKTGRLKRAVNKSIRSITNKQVIWKLDENEVPYAKYLNDGTNKMPRREFMGHSLKLNKKFRTVIEKVMKKYIE